MMCQQSDVLDQERIYNTRLPIDARSQWFELNNAVDSRWNYLGKSPHGPWLVVNRLHDQYESLERTDNKCDSIHAVAHHIQWNIQCRLDPNLSKIKPVNL